MAIHVGSQNAGQINNVEGTRHISGGQVVTTVTIADAVAAAHAVRLALHNVSLPAAVSDRLHQDAAALEQDLAACAPDRGRVAGRLERITTELNRWGALAGAGAALEGPLRTLAGWLGA